MAAQSHRLCPGSGRPRAAIQTRIDHTYITESWESVD